MRTENYTSHHYYIDSKDRLSGSSVDFQVRNAQFDKTHAFRIKSIMIPHTFYNINSHNNILTVRKSGSATDDIVIVDPGNYTIDTLMVALKTALDSKPGAEVFTVTASNIKKTITITVNSGTFIIRGASSINEVLGFSNSDTTTSNSHKAPHVYDLRYTNQIKVFSNTLTKYGTLVRTSGNSGGLLCVVNIYNSQFGENIYHAYNNFMFDIHPRGQEDIDITLLDSRDRVLGGTTGLNDLDISLHLMYHSKNVNDYRATNKMNNIKYSLGGHQNILF